MKIVIINGSPKSSGNSGEIVKGIIELLNRKSIDTKSYHLEGMQYKSCMGCDCCFKNGTCQINDGFKKVYDDIKSAEGIIFVSPTYVSNVPGILKMFIDRGNFVMGQYLTNKRIMNIITYRIADGKRAKKVLDRLALFSGGAVSGGLSLKIPDRINEGHINSVRQKTEEFIRGIAKNKPGKAFQRLIHWAVFNIGIRPGVMKNSEDYTGTIQMWKQMKVID